MFKTYFCKLVLGFFARSEQNHCRNVLWQVNINNYRKKVEISTRVRKGA